MKGIIRLMPITEVKEGMQVIYQKNIVIISTIDSNFITFDKTTKHKRTLGQLIIEYKEDSQSHMFPKVSHPLVEIHNELVKGFKTNYVEAVDSKIKQLSILSSQWQEIVDLDLIDKEVEFKTLITSNGDLLSSITDKKQLAKVILSTKEVKITEVNWDIILVELAMEFSEKTTGKFVTYTNVKLLTNYLKENYHPPKKK